MFKDFLTLLAVLTFISRFTWTAPIQLITLFMKTVIRARFRACQPCPSNCGDAGCTEQFKCINCKAGFFGDYCNKTCSSNCMYKICAKDGSCTCEPGFDGFGCCPQNCEGCNELYECQACKDGHYGKNCTKTCPLKCVGTCSRTEGHCLVCMEGFWEPQCSKSCSDNCLHEQCNQLDGSCPCKPGYKGQHCKVGEKIFKQ